MKTIVCIADGSTGDFLPGLNLGLVLRQQGYSIRGLVPQDLEFIIGKYDLGSGFGVIPLNYTTLAVDNPIFTSGENGITLFRESGKLYRKVLAVAFPHYISLFDSLDPEETTLMFNSPGLSLYGGLAWIKGFRSFIVANPYFYSDHSLKYEPPQFIEMPNFVPVGVQHRIFSFIAYRLLAARVVKDSLRQHLGYTGKIPSYNFLNQQAKRLYLIDPLLADQREVANPATRIIGYAHVPTGNVESIPSDLEDFMVRMRAAGKKIVGASFGSMQVLNGEHLSKMIAQVCAELNCALIMFQGKGGLWPIERDDVHYLDRYLDYASVFPTLDAIISHGGSGITHEALRAGTPLVVVRVLSDQSSWARRMQRIGFVKEPLALETLTPEGLKSVLSYGLDEAVLQKTRAIGAEVRQRQSQLGRVADLID